MPDLITFPSVSADVVGVFNADNFSQVFVNARPMRCTVGEHARAMEHPLESGQIITDYRIILPVEIDMPVVVNNTFYRDTYQQIRQLYQNSTLLSVQTRSAIYDNMIIASMPHEEDPERYDVLTIKLHFKEVQIPLPASDFAPADPADNSTQQLGEQSGSTIITPGGNQVSGLAGQIFVNQGPPLTPAQNDYDITGIATVPVQTGFR